MKKTELFMKIEDEIAQSQLRYEADENDSYIGTVRRAELESLQYLYSRLKDGEEAEEFLAWLRAKLPELEERRERELESPSFDWYDDHYHYKVLDGQCDAYRIMIKLLEQER